MVPSFNTPLQWQPIFTNSIYLLLFRVVSCILHGYTSCSTQQPSPNGITAHYAQQIRTLERLLLPKCSNANSTKPSIENILLEITANALLKYAQKHEASTLAGEKSKNKTDLSHKKTYRSFLYENTYLFNSTHILAYKQHIVAVVVVVIVFCIHFSLIHFLSQFVG